jgi:hypothetical protein
MRRGTAAVLLAVCWLCYMYRRSRLPRHRFIVAL